MRGSDNKFEGQPQPTYEELTYSSRGDDRARPVMTSAPWWNARYWSKKIWGAVAAAVVVVLIVIIAVAVTQVRANRYPDYSKVNYKIKDTYQGAGFFDQFNYFTGYDPTHGFVHYVPKEQAAQLNLTYATDTSAVLKVDTTVGPGSQPDASTGRFSVRVESKNTYNNGLFLFHITHTPSGCGTWPALWLVDSSNWPAHGEIDVMEATNQATDGNQMTLHTAGGCSMSGVKRKQADKSLTTDCNSNDDSNAGCGVQGSQATFGSGFNSANGGVMAVEWRDAGIRMWQFANSSVPADITNGSPDPSTWGVAAADFPSTECDIGSHFKNSSIVLNIDLCGDLVEGRWSESGCPGKCTDLVANQPNAFKDAFWEVGKFEVYQQS